MRILATIILAIMLTACAHTKDAIVPPDTQVVNLDPRVLEPCEPLLKATRDTLETTSVRNIEIYKDCARKQDASIKLLKKFANKEDVK